MPKLYAEVKRVIGDPAVEVVTGARESRPASPPSSLTSELFRALEAAQKKMYPSAVTIPMMLTGATDNAQLRSKGVQAYGFGPAIEESENDLHGPHSDQERLRERSLYEMAEYLWDVVIQVAAAR
jgi:acetylornithine deacetylase/succinyl-diaminopimelate desuccinylase-like protein